MVRVSVRVRVRVRVRVAARACGDEVVAHQSALDKCVPRELGVGHARVLPTTSPRRVSSRPVFWGLC